ncbi:hypothetical protein ACFQX8_07125 [Klenkia terrae]
MPTALSDRPTVRSEVRRRGCTDCLSPGGMSRGSWTAPPAQPCNPRISPRGLSLVEGGEQGSIERRSAGEQMTEAEMPMTGGRITPGVVRVGATVRRPTGAHSTFVHQLLLRYEECGLTCTPRYLGIDPQQREVLSFQPGWVPAPHPTRSWSPGQVHAAAQLLRHLHDATAGTTLAADHPTVCHNDFGPHNTVFTSPTAPTPEAVGSLLPASAMPTSVIDFDGAAPGGREDDVAYAAWLWLLGANVDHRWVDQLVLLGQFLDAYGSCELDLAGLGTRIAARVADVRLMHQRAGRRIATDSWLSDDATYLADRAEDIDRWVTDRP